MAVGPEPTAPGHHWCCAMCQWTGSTLQEAKGHALAMKASGGPFAHLPFEEKVDAADVMSKTARRIMLPSEKPDTVVISSYASARKRLYATLDPLVANLRARGGRLKATRG